MGSYRKRVQSGGKSWLIDLSTLRSGWLIKLGSCLKRSSVPNVPSLEMTRMETAQGWALVI